MITARLAQVCTALLRGNVRVRMVAVLTLACLGAVAVAKFDPANAQGFSWPWENEERPRPAPREPVYRDQPRYAPPPADNRWGPEAANRNSVCLRLEQRLEAHVPQGLLGQPGAIDPGGACDRAPGPRCGTVGGGGARTLHEAYS